MTYTGPDAMTVQEAAVELGVTPTTIYTWVRDGYLGQQLRKTMYRGRAYVSRSDVEAIQRLREPKGRLFEGDEGKEGR